MSDTVLIVDDDPSICKLLSKVMKSNELSVSTASSGTEALNLLQDHSYDLILLDIMLGDLEGFEIIKDLRQRGILTPIIVISGRNEDYDTLYALSLGADDYITKPFRPVIVGAKVKALLRRNKNHILTGNHRLTRGPFSYDSSTMKFYKDEQELVLSAKEAGLMLLFLKHPNQVFTKETIYEQVWGSGSVDDNTIMVYINRLRSKIEKSSTPKHIITVRGIGYRFVP